MVRSSRLHRLPQRLDYTLIPAPLDLTFDEKSPLPAIIVTPSSPRNSTDFSIAFLAPEPKPSLRERVISHLPRLSAFSSEQPISLATTPSKSSFPSLSAPSKARSVIIIFILLFVMACHMIAHRFAITPRMNFQTKGLGLGEVDIENTHIHGSLSQSQPNAPRVERSTNWLTFWETYGDAPDFVVTESMRIVGDVENVEDTTDTSPNLA